MNKIERRLRRKKGIRKNIYGIPSKPRITVYRSNKHLYVQAIDDLHGNTLCSSSDFDAGIRKNLKGASAVGLKLAEKLLKKNVKDAIFDRNGYIYHGLVKAVADGVRKGGIKV